MLIRSILLLVLSLATPATADRYDALRADPEIASGVLVAAIGDMIADNCPDIGERRTRSLLMLNALVGRARALGYSVGEIRAYVDDDTEKDRVKGQARQWMSANGASAADRGSICRVARKEIADGTTIGRLMYEK
ncbi:hypothetical protein SAMN05444004_105136 [Jannaschia faecimaris]|uniref:DUF5333 domain-containing protein n=1 Tax=Jannaschia faecimaris TaxID=1244108 RepID=A0A1H3PRJ4_9RHOB|nr:DUF5333 domain-containing protein [Jannaschia faecimaris]SDZ03902.1 hypothetical protein SAMN05444004_105136 [Jannaschia faecimaris]